MKPIGHVARIAVLIITILAISSQSIVIPSNVSVVCDPGSSTFIVGGTGSIDFPIVRIENATNFALRNCVIDGSQSAANTSPGLIIEIQPSQDRTSATT